MTELILAGYKQCFRCKETKPFNGFHKNNVRKDGLGCYCKECIKIKGQKYRKENSEKIRIYEKKQRLKHREQKREYHREYYQRNIERFREYYLNNKEENQKYSREYRRKNPEKTKATSKKYHKKLRLTVLQKISGLDEPKCVNCGCNDLQFLQINHINGGGGKEIKNITPGKFFYNIVKGVRKTNDLNILCYPCNALDHLKRKHGDVPIQIIWNDKKHPTIHS